MQENSSILLLDDDPDVLIAAKFLLKKKYQKVISHSSLAGLDEVVDDHEFNVALLDMNYTVGDTSGKDGFKALEIIKGKSPETQIIMMTAYGDIDMAITAIKHGAFDFIVKPWDNSKLLSTVQNAYQHSVKIETLEKRNTAIKANGKQKRDKSDVERIFMFLDLNSSTAIAESLGHNKYFNFLNDFFSDISDPIFDWEGEVYQYVGDEVVITWDPARGFQNNACVKCFYAIIDKIDEKEGYYFDRYGVKPVFKAGMHMGIVTTGVVGAVKKEIVYTGDVLNTTSRLEALCNGYGEKLLISGAINERLGIEKCVERDLIGSIALKGKNKQVEIYAVHRI